MDRFKHSDNIALPRLALFDALQSMTFGNISKMLNGIYVMEDLKIMCGESELGLLDAPDFMVSYSSGKILVAPGVAINDSSSFIYNADTQSMSTSMSNGVYYVYVKYKQNKALTGKETMLPVKGTLNTENLYTIITDSAEVGIGEAAPYGSIPLAIVAITSNVVPGDSNYGTLTRDLYMNESTGAMPRSGGASIPSWGMSNIVARIGNEYIRINASGEILNRGYLGTIIEHHYAGSSVTIPSIVDMRQLSLLKVRGSNSAIKAAAKGVTLVGDGQFRSLCTRLIKRHTASPIINSSSPAILWVNRGNAMNMITDKVKNIYYGIQATNVNISNNKAIIQDIRSRMLGANETERLNLSVEMRRAQQDLIMAHGAQQEALSAISADEISGYMKSIPNVFHYVIAIAHASMVEDGIVQYEAEVVRSLISSIASSNGVPPDKYYSDMVRPIGYTVTGDKIYPALNDADRVYIKIPISIGERVTVRVRPINENNIYGSYSNAITYEFARYDDNEYATYQMIYDIIAPDMIANAATLREYVAYIKELWEQMSSANNQVRDYQARMISMESRIAEIERKLVNIDPVIPHIPKLMSVAQNENIAR